MRQAGRCRGRILFLLSQHLSMMFQPQADHTTMSTRLAQRRAQSIDMNDDMDAKNNEIRDLKKKIQELEDQIGDLQASDQANDSNSKEYKAMYERSSHMAREKQKECDRLSAELLQANLRVQAELAKDRMPDVVYLTKAGECFHKDGCNHLMHGRNPRPKQAFTRCRDCWRG